MEAAADDEQAPYFAFEGDVKAVPDYPTHCQGCGVELEPLRRWGGYCRECVSRRFSSSQPPPAEMVLVRVLYRQRVGHRERFVEARCACGRSRVLAWWTWQNRRPANCNKCRLRSVDRRGFWPETERREPNKFVISSRRNS